MTGPVKKKNKSPLNVKYEKERLRIIFEYSPVAIWEEDFSALLSLKKVIRKKKIKNIKRFLSANPALVRETFRKITVLDVNKAALQLYGAKTKKELIQNLGRSVHKSALHVLEDEFAALLRGEQTFEAEFKSRTLKGHLADVVLKVSVPDLYKDSFKRVVVTLQDISLQKKYEKHLKKIARTDGLTRLLNHNSLVEKIEEEFARARRYGLKLSCMMIDVDHFKRINDEFGHEQGNLVLKRVAKCIKDNLRNVDIVGRYGGDEFLAILPETTPENALIAALRIKNVFERKAAETKRKKMYPTVSIGVTGIDVKGAAEVNNMLKRVDKAMYAAKKAGRNQAMVR